MTILKLIQHQIGMIATPSVLELLCANMD